MSFRICVIGCGTHSSFVHGPSYKKYAMLHNDVTLAACCDIDREKAKTYAEKFGFMNIYTEVDDMLDAEKPNVVCLISPVELTAGIALMVIERGYPLFLEKPPGRTAEETKMLVNASEMAGVPVRVAFNRRYMPLVRELKRRLTTPKKDILNIQYDIIRVDRRDSDFSTTAIHGIDAVGFLAGSQYNRVHFHYQDLPHIGPGVADIMLDCTFLSGCTAQLGFFPVSGVVTERASVKLHNHVYFLELPVWGGLDSPGRILEAADGKRTDIITGDDFTDGNEMFESGGFYYENADFFDSLRLGKGIYSDIDQAVQSVEIADCIRNRKPEYYYRP